MSEVTSPPTPNTILLRGKQSETHVEGRASTTITPGFLISKTTSGDYPYGKWAPHPTAGGLAEKVVALEGRVADVPGLAFTGGTIDDDYLVDQLVFAHHCQPGDELYMFLKASGSAVILTDNLESAGDGTLRKLASGVALFHVLEAKTPGSSKTRIRVRAL